MNAPHPSSPARIVKRGDVSATPARPAAAASGEPARSAPAPAQRPFAKDARLVPGAPGTAAVDVRCSCGEWTRIELRTGTKEETK
jgi:hypothetical protein